MTLLLRPFAPPHIWPLDQVPLAVRAAQQQFAGFRRYRRAQAYTTHAMDLISRGPAPVLTTPMLLRPRPGCYNPQ